MRFRPLVVKRRALSPNRGDDLVAVYEASNQSVIAIKRVDYEKNKAKYDGGPAPTLKPRPAKTEPAPVAAAPPPVVKETPKPAPAEAASFASLIFQPPKIKAVTLSPDDLVAVYDAATQSVLAVKRSQYESGNFGTSAPAPAPTPAPAAAVTKAASTAQ